MVEGALDVPARELAARELRVYVRRDPSRQPTIAQLVQMHQAAFKNEVVGRGSYDAPTENIEPITDKGNLALSYPFGAQVVEVEVDCETGRVSVLGVTSASDIGRAINRWP